MVLQQFLGVNYPFKNEHCSHHVLCNILHLPPRHIKDWFADPDQLWRNMFTGHRMFSTREIVLQNLLKLKCLGLTSVLSVAWGRISH